MGWQPGGAEASRVLDCRTAFLPVFVIASGFESSSCPGIAYNLQNSCIAHAGARGPGRRFLMRFANLIFRFAAATAVVGAAMTANAWDLTFGGTYTNPNTDNEQLTILYQFSDLLGNNFNVNDVSYAYGGGLSSGFLDASSAAGGILDLNFSGTDVFAGGTHTMAGIWTDNTPPTTANTLNTGTYSASFDGVGDFNFTFVGQRPAPEPTTIVAMAVGIGSLLSRRRKRV